VVACAALPYTIARWVRALPLPAAIDTQRGQRLRMSVRQRGLPERRGPDGRSSCGYRSTATRTLHRGSARMRRLPVFAWPSGKSSAGSTSPSGEPRNDRNPLKARAAHRVAEAVSSQAES
jgi:hypothetical protein